MENLTNWCVYMHENRVNGKRYIGITSQKPTNRWQNGHGYHRCPIFYAAIQKYGWDAFRHEILYTGLTQKEAEQLEMDLIAKYDTQNREKGYNLAAGGETNAGFHRTEDFKRRLSLSRTGVYSGERHNMYGMPRTEETREKIQAAQKGKPKSRESCEKMKASAERRWSSENIREREHLRECNLGGNSAKARPVKCVETGAEYSAISDAARESGVGLTGIVRCCQGKRQTAGGFHWVYLGAVASE